MAYRKRKRADERKLIRLFHACIAMLSVRGTSDGHLANAICRACSY